MDVLLDLADHFLLDKVWAKLVPLPANNQLFQIVGPTASSLFSNVTSVPLTAAKTPLLLTLANALPVSLRPPPPSSLLASSLLSDPATLESLSAFPRTYVLRQLFSILTLTVVGIHILYFLFATLSYYLIFDHRMMRHPRFLKDQVKLEIMCSLWAFPTITIMTIPWFLGEVRGWSRLYGSWGDVGKYGWTYLVFSVPLWVFFSLEVSLLGHTLTRNAPCIVASWSSQITASTGFTVSSTGPSFTRTSTNPITNGSFLRPLPRMRSIPWTGIRRAYRTTCSCSCSRCIDCCISDCSSRSTFGASL